MESRLVDFKNKLNLELSELERAVAPFEGDHPEVAGLMKDIRAIYHDKVEAAKPLIMVFGIYNAGKSSILNELLREDKAKVADIPTTDHVEYYHWRGYTVADTPGVGAPIRHERVTNEAIRKSDVVLFVMSAAGSYEKKENYTRMKDIVDTGKKVIIILNDKNGDLLSSPETIFAVRQKVYENMQAIGIEDVDRKFVIVCVNAAMARKGRIQNKKILWDKSGMDQLESVILTEMKKTSDFDLLRHAVYEISSDVAAIQKALVEKGSNAAADGLQEIMDNLSNAKLAMRKDMNDFITSRTNRLPATLPDRIWAVKDDEAKQKQVMDEVQNALVDQVTRHFQSLLADVANDYARDLETYVQNMKKVQLDFYHIKIQKMDDAGIPEDKLPDSNDVIQKMGSSIADGYMTKETYEEMAKQGEKLAAGMLEKMGCNLGKKSAGDFILDSGEKLAKEGLKKVGVDVGRKGIGKYVLGKLGLDTVITKIPVPFPPVEVVLIGYTVLKHFLGDDGSYERERAKAERENAIARAKAEAEMQMLQKLQQQCEYISEDIHENLRLWSNDAIRETVGSLERDLREQMKSVATHQEDVMAVQQALSDILESYHGILDALGSAQTVED